MKGQRKGENERRKGIGVGGGRTQTDIWTHLQRVPVEFGNVLLSSFTAPDLP